MGAGVGEGRMGSCQDRGRENGGWPNGTRRGQYQDLELSPDINPFPSTLAGMGCLDLCHQFGVDPNSPIGAAA